MAQPSNIVDFQTARGTRAPARAHGGYIRLYRSTLESAFSNKPNHLATWVHLLGMATHKPIKTMLAGRSIELQRGQFISGRKALAARIGITEKQLRNILDFMVDEGMITMDARRAGTIFTVLNFDFYQSDRGQPSTPAEATDNGASGEKRANDGPTRGQPRANDFGQQKGQPEASNHGAYSETEANERANQEPAKRATKYKNTNTSTTSNAREDDDQHGLEAQQAVADHRPDQPTHLDGDGTAEAFAMHLDWQPSEELSKRCHSMGIDLQAVPMELAGQWLGEFRSFWDGESRLATQARWEHKLAQCFAHQIQRMAKTGERPVDDRPPIDTGLPIASRSDRKAARAVITESIMNIHDTSWGD